MGHRFRKVRFANMHHVLPETVMLVGSSVCDLCCSYCYLNKNTVMQSMDAEIVSAYESGEYLRNVGRVLERLGCGAGCVKYLEIWGAEPTIHLDIISKHISEWLSFFFRVEKILILTNLANSVPRLLGFIDALEAYRRPLLFQIQVSDDILEDCNSNRGVESKKLQENRLKLLKGIRDKNLKYVRVELTTKVTWTFDKYIEYFTSIEKTERYCETVENLYQEMCNYTNGSKLSVRKGFVPGLVTPYPYTKADGLAFAHAARVNSEVDKSRYTCFAVDANFIMDRITAEPGCVNGSFCGQMSKVLHILPDGSLSGCPAGYFDGVLGYREYVQANQPDVYKSIEHMSHLSMVNPLISSEEDLDEWRHLYVTGIKDASIATIQATSLLMYEMAECGLVSRVYRGNKDLIARHANIIKSLDGCFYHNMRNTGSFSTPAVHHIILWCNGAMMEYEFLRASRVGVR